MSFLDGFSKALVVFNVAVGELLAQGEPLVVALGDCVIDSQGSDNVLQRMIGLFDERQADIVIAFETVSPEKVDRFGIAKPLSDDSVFELADLVEKREVQSVSARQNLRAQQLETLTLTVV